MRPVSCGGEMCPANDNQEEKSAPAGNKIFRPWDNFDQDCTISTTTGDEINGAATSPVEDDDDKQGFRPVEMAPETAHFPQSYSELVHQAAGIVQNFGGVAATNDPFFLESFFQGCAFEDYARVLKQEHQAKILGSRKQRPKKYKCPHCDVGFSNNGQLKGHIRIHTGERPFKCDEKDCGKTFTRNEELTRHKRIHSGLRPFPCTHCGKRFGRKDHLKKHSRTHFQSRGVYAVPVMLPFETWAASSSSMAYPYMPPMYAGF